MTDPERPAKIQQEFGGGIRGDEAGRAGGLRVRVGEDQPGHPEYEQACRVGAGIARQGGG